jgi:hypothetical protein
MRYSKKTKNAELLGLRFPISFFRMKDELVANVRNEYEISKPTFEFHIPTFTPLIK